MKKILSTLLILLVFVVCITGSAIADTDYSNAKIIVNGMRIALFDNDNNLLQPANIDGVLYVPIESLITNIGGSYTYDSADNTITINLNNYTVSETSIKAEDDLESKAFTWASSTRDSRIETCKKVANAFMSYAKKYFKNPSSIRLEKAYNGIFYYILDISGENSMGGRTRILYDVDTETYEVSEALLGSSMISMASELTGDDFEWFASLFK